MGADGGSGERVGVGVGLGVEVGAGAEVGVGGGVGVGSVPHAINRVRRRANASRAKGGNGRRNGSMAV